MVPAVNVAPKRLLRQASGETSSRTKVPLPWMELKYPIPERAFSASRMLERLTPKVRAILRCDGNFLPGWISPAFNWFNMIPTTDSTVVAFTGLPA
jgi:hypothetical protein